MTEETKKETLSQMRIEILLGSTREGRMGKALGTLVMKHITDILKTNNLNATVGIIDLCEFKVPFLADAMPPMYRDPDTITDPEIKKFSTAVRNADLIVMLSPIYNFGITGVLKNALDTLYREWNDKHVAFVGYSGGPTGGTEGIAMLRTITLKALKMKQIVAEEDDILIPSIFNCFDPKTGSFHKQEDDDKLRDKLQTLVKAYTTNQKATSTNTTPSSSSSSTN